MKKKAVEYTTIKINSKTAAKLKKFVQKNGSTIAGYASATIERAMVQDNGNDWVNFKTPNWAATFQSKESGV